MRTTASNGDPNNFSTSVASVELATGAQINFPRSGVTAIVGPNNCGKSTLLRQITTHLTHGQRAAEFDSTFLVSRIAMSLAGTADDAIAWLKKHSVAVESGGGQSSFHSPGRQGIHEADARNAWERASDSGFGDLNSFFVFYGDAWGRLQGASSTEQRDIFSAPPASPLHILEDDYELFDELNRISLEVFRQPLTLDRLSRQVNLRIGNTGIPAPAVDRVSKEYLTALARLPHLMDQGDGMKSLLGLLAPLVTSTYPIVFIDEPEAFLHPPQAAAIGKILGEQAKLRGIQVILATHDRNLLAGLLESEAQVSIVRLDRSADNETSAHQLDVSELRSIWSDPVLRYSNVLDGLFHRLVVLAEGDRDCRFYSAALEAAAPEIPLPFPPGDVLFVPSGGKDGMPRLAKVLRSVNVPVVASPDIDVLNNRETIKAIVESIGADWTEVQQDYAIATEPFRQPRDKVTVGQVLSALNGIFGERGEMAFTAEVKRDFAAQIRSKESPWADLKEYGERAFKGQSAQAAKRLLERLDAMGIVAVRVGELECFAPALGVAKGAAWLPAAINAGAHKETAARRHVAALTQALNDG
ncbi:ATP-dependent nuclease [Streptomyces mirabilis]|uniref:ATP-dependent nuclease n=1 Tax=Streptomyces mirabilis TaxID=68239 RepID=UPI0036A9BDD3